MSRILKVMIVLLAITAMIAPSVFAEDRLSLSGQYRVRGFYIDNQFDFDDDAAGAKHYFNQRLRVQSTVAVAEGVKLDFRLDVSDKTWGQANTNIGTDNDNKYYVTIDKDMFTLMAGRQSYAVGNAIAVDTLGEQFVLKLKGPVGVELAYAKVAEDATTDDDNDSDLYTVAVKHSTDMYTGSVFGGFYRDGSARAAANEDALEVMLIGTAATFNLDAIKLNVEIDYFNGDDGDAGAANTDYKGLQGYVDVAMAASETVSVGGMFFYAQGADANEVQVDNLSDDGSFLPETYSFMQLQYNVFPTGNGSLNTTFDPTGDDKGVIAGQVYGQVKISDDLSLRAAMGYWTTEEDYTAAEKAGAEAASAYDSFITAVGSARYAFAPNTNLDFVAAYTQPDAAVSTTKDDAALLGAFNLNVNF